MEIVATSESQSHQFAIEHTRIESFSGQIAGGAAFERVLRPLETILSSKLAGHYWLIVPADASQRVRTKDTERVQAILEERVVTEATTLEAKNSGSKKPDSITAILDGIPFQVTLIRTRYPGNRFGIVSNTPEELETLRVQRVNTALKRKVSKAGAVPPRWLLYRPGS